MNKNLFSQIREIFVCGKRHYSHYYTLPLVITCTISVTCVASITLPISLWPYHCLCLHQLFADSSSNLPALNYYLCLSVERLDASLYTLSFSATFMQLFLTSFSIFIVLSLFDGKMFLCLHCLSLFLPFLLFSLSLFSFFCILAVQKE